jgi:HAD superfamily hydrolase (TIGR01490 family)
MANALVPDMAREPRSPLGFARQSSARCLLDTCGRDSDVVTTPPKVRRSWHRGLHTPVARVAVFDLDRTLIPGASAVALLRELAARKLVTRQDVVRAGLEHALYRRRGSTDAQMERARRRGLSIVAGMECEPLLAAADVVASSLVPTVCPAARFLLDRHLNSGDFCVLLSSSPQELVERVGRLLGMHRSIGTRATVANGRYTGGLDRSPCYGPGKLEALRLALGDADLQEAFAYADSASDLALLRACGHPVAVNPDRTLHRVARQEGWPILVLG